MDKTYPARVRDGTTYTGNQQFKGLGIVKWCALCGSHKSQEGGGLRTVFGSRHWVCAKHKKPEAK
jgi:hypothetical protein